MNSRYTILTSNKFERDLQKCVRRGFDIRLLKEFVSILENGEVPDQSYKTHPLKGNFKGYLDSHLKPDWIVIWKRDNLRMELTLLRTGTHADLF